MGIPGSQNRGTVPYKAIFWGDTPLHSPYIGLIYGRYLQFKSNLGSWNGHWFNAGRGANHGTAHLSLLRPGVQEDLNICGSLNTSRWVRRPRRTGGLVGPGHRTTHMRFSLHNSNYASIGISMIPPFRANAFQTSHSNPTWQRLKPAKSHPSIDLRLKEFSSCAPMVLLPEPTCPQIATERCGRSSSDIALDS